LPSVTFKISEPYWQTPGVRNLKPPWGLAFNHFKIRELYQQTPGVKKQIHLSFCSDSYNSRFLYLNNFVLDIEKYQQTILTKG